jgi:dihydrofolate reductase
LTLEVSIIVAIDKNNGIGINGKMPWRLSSDMRYFKKITTKTSDPNKRNVVIMGRKTWESLPERYRPLSDRINAVLSRKKNIDLPSDVMSFNCLNTALSHFNSSKIINSINKVFIIGGGEIYKETLSNKLGNKLYTTKIFSNFSCDTFFPNFEKDFSLIKTSGILKETDLDFAFEVYKKIN